MVVKQGWLRMLSGLMQHSSAQALCRSVPWGCYKKWKSFTAKTTILSLKCINSECAVSNSSPLPVSSEKSKNYLQRKNGKDSWQWSDFPSKVVVQLNDTHPTLATPEFYL